MTFQDEIHKRARQAKKEYSLASKLDQPIKVHSLFTAFQQDLIDSNNLTKNDFETTKYTDSFTLRPKNRMLRRHIGAFREFYGTGNYISISNNDEKCIEFAISPKKDNLSIDDVIDQGIVPLQYVAVSRISHFYTDSYFFKIQEDASFEFLGFTEIDSRMANWLHYDHHGKHVKTVPCEKKDENGEYQPSLNPWRITATHNLPTTGTRINFK